MIQGSEGGERHHWLKGVWLKGAGASGSKGCGSRVLVLVDVPHVFAGVREFGAHASCGHGVLADADVFVRVVNLNRTCIHASSSGNVWLVSWLATQFAGDWRGG